MKRISWSICLGLVIVFIIVNISFAKESNIWPKYEPGKGTQIKTVDDVFSAKIDLRSQFQGLWSEDGDENGASLLRSWFCAAGYVRLPSDLFKKITYDFKFDVKDASLLDLKLGSAISFGFGKFFFNVGQYKAAQSVKEIASVWSMAVIGSRPLANEKFNTGRRPGSQLGFSFWEGKGEVKAGIFSANGKNEGYKGQHYAGSFFISFGEGEYKKRVPVSLNPKQPLIFAFAGSYALTKITDSNIGSIASDDCSLKSLGINKISLTDFNTLYGGNLDVRIATGYAGLRWDRFSLAIEGYHLDTSSSGLEPMGRGFYTEANVWIFSQKLLLTGIYSQASFERGGKDIFNESQLQFGPKYYPFSLGEGLCIGMYYERIENMLKDKEEHSVQLKFQFKL